MQYNFPKEEFIEIPGKKNPCYREKPIDDLSAQDIEGIQVLYGTPDSTGAGAMMRKGEDAIPASMPDSAVNAARADLGKLATEMNAVAAGTTARARTG